MSLGTHQQAGGASQPQPESDEAAPVISMVRSGVMRRKRERAWTKERARRLATSGGGPSDEAGAAAVEYGVVCGAAVGIGGLLWKLLTSSYGEAFIKSIFNAVKGLLPF